MPRLFNRNFSPLILVYLFLTCRTLFSQSIHIGARVNFVPFQLYSVKPTEYYLSDLQNTTVRYNAIKNTNSDTAVTVRAISIFPEVYVRYNFKNHFFAEVAYSYLYRDNLLTDDIIRTRYLNATDYEDYSTPDDDNSYSIEFSQNYFAYSARFSYQFFQKHKVQMGVIGGLNLYQLISVNRNSNLSVVRKAAWDEYGNFKKIVLYVSAGLEFTFRSFNTGARLLNSLTPIDGNKPKKYSNSIIIEIYMGYHFLSFKTISNKNLKRIKSEIRK